MGTALGSPGKERLCRILVPLRGLGPIGDNGTVTNQPSTSETAPIPDAERAEGEVGRPQPSGRQQASAYMSGSVANMIRSVVVIAAIMALFMVMAPRLQPDHSGVDAVETAQQVHDSFGLAVSVPTDLPEGWVATRAEYRRGADGLMTWHALYETPEGGAVALNQAADATDAWVAQTVNRTEQTGERELDGAVWETYAREGSMPQRSLVDRGEDGEVTTVVTGDAPWELLETFVAALTPAQGS